MQAITEAGKPQEKAQNSGGHGTLIAALQIYGVAIQVAEAPGTSCPSVCKISRLS